MTASVEAHAAPGALAPPPVVDKNELSLPVTLLELELSLTAFDGDEESFGRTVRVAAQASGGGLLFELPASGLLPDCHKIAVLHIPRESEQGKRIVLAVLDTDKTIRLEEPTEATAGLVRLAEAFVDVLKRI